MVFVKSLLIGLCIAVSADVPAQHAYLFVDPSATTTEYVASVLEKSNGNYVAALRKIKPDSTYCRFVELTSEGVVVKSSTIRGGTNLLINALVETQTGILAFGTDEGQDSGFFVSLVLDDDLLIKSRFDQNLGVFEYSGAYATMLDSMILVSGAVSLSNASSRAFAALISFDGQILKFNPDFADDLISNGIQLKSTDEYLFFGFRNQAYRADANLDLKSQSDTPFSLQQEGSLAWVNDSTIALVGKRVNNIFFPPFDNSRNIGIGLLDKYGNEKTLHQIGMTGDTIDFPAYNQAVSVSGDSRIFVGGNGNAQIGSWLYGNQPSWLILSRLNPQGLKPSWVRFYGGDAYYSVFGVLPTSDGGCLLYGSKYDKWGIQDADAFILKVDGSGNPTTATAEPKIAPTGAPITVSPNPSNGIFNVHTPIGGQLSCIVSSANGHIIGHLKIDNRLDISGLPIGTYVTSFYHEGRFVGSVKLVKGE